VARLFRQNATTYDRYTRSVANERRGLHQRCRSLAIYIFFSLNVLQLYEPHLTQPATLMDIQRAHNRIIYFYWTVNVGQLSQAKLASEIFFNTPRSEAMIDTPEGFSAHGNHWIELQHAIPTSVGSICSPEWAAWFVSKIIPLWHDSYRSSRRVYQGATSWSKPFIAFIALTWHSAITNQRIGCATEVPKQHGKSEAVACKRIPTE
jgi:hypothetical protein